MRLPSRTKFRINGGDNIEYKIWGRSLSRKGIIEAVIIAKRVITVVAASRSEVRKTSEKRVKGCEK